MKTLIRIVFVIFIANVIDCLGEVCDNCCDCFNCFKKKDENEDKDENEKIEEYEEIKEDENNTAKSLVSDDWFKAKENNKENNLVLKIFKKKDNSKIDRQNGPKKLKLEDQKYALFEIKTQKEETVYLYCSDIESCMYDGIFKRKTHVSISVIACDTEKVTNMEGMFSCCSNLTELDLKNFNTTNVINRSGMFSECSLPQKTQDKILIKK